MKDKQICPLISIGTDEYINCKRKECEWWNDVYKGCAIHSLFYIHQELENK